MTPEEILDKVRTHPRLVIVDDFELVVEKGDREARTYHCGEARSSESESYTWVSLRILHRRQPGRAVMAVESPDAIPLLIENAFISSQLSSPDPWFRFPLWRVSSESAPSEGTCSLPGSRYDSNLLGPWEMEEEMEQRTSERWIFRRTERKQLRARHAYSSSRYRLERNGVRGEWDERLGANLSEAVAGAAFAMESREWSQVSKNYPRHLLFCPQAVAAWMPELAQEFCGDKILEGSAPLGLPKDQKMWNESVRLVDHGALSGGRNTWPFDLEGSPTQETRLVEEGRYRSMLLDCHAAARDNRLSTGNFVKGDLLEWPRVGPSNFYLEAGLNSESVLLAAIKMGVCVETISRDSHGRWWGRGWRVESGQRKENLHQIPLPSDLRTVLKQQIELGNNLTFFGEWGSPSILCDDLPLSNG